VFTTSQFIVLISRRDPVTINCPLICDVMEKWPGVPALTLRERIIIDVVFTAVELTTTPVD
jgi:hypothetical protein